MAGQNKTGKEQISFDRIRKITSDKNSTVHFIGIGGVSMYSLACIAMLRGARVSGSDREESERTKKLAEKGALISIGHSTENIADASLVVYTHAISPDNIELWEAQRRAVPIVSRAEFMGAMMLGYSNRIGISGSHGKSTTVAMLDCIMSHAGTDPTVLSGADLSMGEPLKVGSDQLMIYEACEYKDSFLRFSPTISVGLNLELDHTDYFSSLDEMKQSFTKALGKASSVSVISGDDENLRRIMKNIKTRVVTFGSRYDNDYQYRITSFRDHGFEFSLSRFGSEIGRLEINLYGVFNVHNAVAAAVAALEYGIDFSVIYESLKEFSGISRRLELIGRRFLRPIYYDYAHHPTEIAAAINAMKMAEHEQITVIFRPHTYTRTQSLWQELIHALSLADYLVLTDIYPAREKPISGITSERLAREISHGAVCIKDGEVVNYVDQHTHGIILLMGAGDVEKIKKDLLD